MKINSNSTKNQFLSFKNILRKNKTYKVGDRIMIIHEN